MIDKNVASYL